MSAPDSSAAQLWRYTKLVVGALLLAIAFIFAVENAEPATVRFLSWQFDLSLSLLIVFVLLIGVVLGMIIAGWLRWRRQHRAKS